MSSAPVAVSDERVVERLLYDEADCLDRADLDAWIEFYTDDATYWMPVAPDQTEPHSHISLFYDDRLLMEIRRRNFGHRFAASMEYPIRCSHVISNVRVVEGSVAAGRCRTTANFQAVVYYKEAQTVYAGRYTHELVASGERLKIRSKRVDLINSDGEHGNLVIYL